MNIIKTKRQDKFPALSTLVLLIFLFLCSLITAQETENPRKCIMVFGAHADDVDEIAGGTLAKYMDNGYEGVYVCYTNNTAGCNLERTPHFDEGPDFTISASSYEFPVGGLESIQIREEEARQAAAVFGAIPEFLYFRETWFWMGRKQCYIGSDEWYQYQPPGRQVVSVATRSSKDVGVVIDLLRKYKPEIVIMHTLGGEKHDHGNGAYIMYQAFTRAMDQNIPVGKLWMTVNGWLLDKYNQDNCRGIPDVQIEVEQYLDTKYEALDKHVSQNGGFGRNYVINNRVQPKEVIEEFITVIDNTN
ncbi:MAG: PIG-L family deacetylase [Bacteroidales bacterium]|nr:PIG-L family deacetylase [Bacteroidales bacterium]